MLCDPSRIGTIRVGIVTWWTWSGRPAGRPRPERRRRGSGDPGGPADAVPGGCYQGWVGGTKSIWVFRRASRCDFPAIPLALDPFSFDWVARPFLGRCAGPPVSLHVPPFEWFEPMDRPFSSECRYPSYFRRLPLTCESHTSARRRAGRLKIGPRRSGAECDTLLPATSAASAGFPAAAAGLWPRRAGGLDLSAMRRGPGAFGLSQFRPGLVSGDYGVAVNLPSWPA